MPAFMIVTAVIHDREKFISGYAEAAGELVPKFGGQYLLRGRGGALLEGEGGDGGSVLVSQWPDRASIERFWNSPEYAEAKRLRDGIADCTVLVVEGERLG